MLVVATIVAFGTSLEGSCDDSIHQDTRANGLQRKRRTALRYACEIADRFEAALHILHVEKEPVPYHGYDFNWDEETRRKIEELPGDPWDQKLQVTRNVRMGPPFLEIICEAKDKSIDLIVMGTHGYGLLKHMLIGSVAEKVVRKAPCPVLTIRHPAHEFVMP